MARRLLHLTVQQEEPDRNSLWINPYNGVARIYAYNKGWVALQGPLIAQVSDRLDEAVLELTAKIDAKQDALTAGDNITIEDGVISATDTKPYVVTDALPNMPTAADADSLFLVPDGDGAYEAWAWADGAWARVGDTHEEITAKETDGMWDKA